MDFLYLRFLVKVVKGNSLMFSLVIALGFIGFSTFGELREVFREFGIAWPIAWIGSALFVGYLAKQEHRLKLRPKFKLYLCLSLMGFGIVSGFLLSVYERILIDDIPRYDLDTSTGFSSSNFERRRGPPGKRH